MDEKIASNIINMYIIYIYNAAFGIMTPEIELFGTVCANEPLSFVSIAIYAKNNAKITYFGGSKIAAPDPVDPDPDPVTTTFKSLGPYYI